MATRTEINRKLPPGIDGRTSAALRWKELVKGYEQAFVIEDRFDGDLIGVAATLTLRIEDLQAAQLRRQAVDSDELLRLVDRRNDVLGHLKRDTRIAASQQGGDEMARRRDRGGER